VCEGGKWRGGWKRAENEWMMEIGEEERADSGYLALTWKDDDDDDDDDADSNNTNPQNNNNIRRYGDSL
jgi:hypothetical protein